MVLRAVRLAFVERHGVAWSNPQKVGLGDTKERAKPTTGTFALIDDVVRFVKIWQVFRRAVVVDKLTLDLDGIPIEAVELRLHVRICQDIRVGRVGADVLLHRPEDCTVEVVVTWDEAGVRFEFQFAIGVFPHASKEVFELACTVGERLYPIAATPKTRIRGNVGAPRGAHRVDNVDQRLPAQDITWKEELVHQLLAHGVHCMLRVQDLRS